MKGTSGRWEENARESRRQEGKGKKRQRKSGIGISPEWMEKDEVSLFHTHTHTHTHPTVNSPQCLPEITEAEPQYNFIMVTKIIVELVLL